MFKYLFIAGAGFAVAKLLTPKQTTQVVKTVGGRNVVVTEVKEPPLGELPSSSAE